MSRDPAFRTQFPAVDTQDRGQGDQILVSFDSRSQALPENRWQGSNTAHYVNPGLDPLFDRLYGSIDAAEQGPLLRQTGEILATDVPVLPLYFKTSFAAVRQGIRAMRDDYPGTRGSGGASRFAHLWDRD